MSESSIKTTKAVIAIIALSILSGCATPKARLRAGLEGAGLPPATASCMTDYMYKRLSITQLRRLQSLSTVKDVDYSRITLNQYMHKVRALKDAELMTVTGKAALHCSF